MEFKKQVKDFDRESDATMKLEWIDLPLFGSGLVEGSEMRFHCRQRSNVQYKHRHGSTQE